MTPSPISTPLRALIVIVLCGVMAIGPASTQMFNVHNKWIRSWVMYRAAAVDLCWADFSTRTASGDFTPINRYNILGYRGMWDAPKDIRWLRGPHGVTKVTTRMCSKMGPNSDIRAVGECASVSGWTRAFDGKTNLCPPAKPATDKTKTKSKAAAKPEPKGKQKGNEKGKNKGKNKGKQKENNRKSDKTPAKPKGGVTP